MLRLLFNFVSPFKTYRMREKPFKHFQKNKSESEANEYDDFDARFFFHSQNEKSNKKNTSLQEIDCHIQTELKSSISRWSYGCSDDSIYE